MHPRIRVGTEFLVPDELVGASTVSDLIDPNEAAEYAKGHVLAGRCDEFVARDAGDNLIVLIGDIYHYWDHLTDRLIVLGKDPRTFITGNEDE